MQKSCDPSRQEQCPAGHVRSEQGELTPLLLEKHFYLSPCEMARGLCIPRSSAFATMLCPRIYHILSPQPERCSREDAGSHECHSSQPSGKHTEGRRFPACRTAENRSELRVTIICRPTPLMPFCLSATRNLRAMRTAQCDASRGPARACLLGEEGRLGATDSDKRPLSPLHT